MTIESVKYLSSFEECLKLQSCKLCNNNYMITSTQITKTEIFAFIAALAFKLLSREVLFIHRKDRNFQKVR